MEKYGNADLDRLINEVWDLMDKSRCPNETVDDSFSRKISLGGSIVRTTIMAMIDAFPDKNAMTKKMIRVVLDITESLLEDLHDTEETRSYANLRLFLLSNKLFGTEINQVLNDGNECEYDMGNLKKMNRTIH